MDIDQLSRAMKDLEYRVKLLERAHEPRRWFSDVNSTRVGSPNIPEQFCECGKDRLLCRAPDCPSHKQDPMGR